MAVILSHVNAFVKRQNERGSANFHPGGYPGDDLRRLIGWKLQDGSGGEDLLLALYSSRSLLLRLFLAHL